MNKETELFEKAPVLRGIVLLVVPTIISQLILVLYNMADTFFIGRAGDPNQVAAANLCMPIFYFLTGFSNIFGIGGASLISRCLGTGDRKKAGGTFSFCFWSAAAIALIYGIVVYNASPVILTLFGADSGTYTFCRQYIFWTTGIGAVPTVLNAVMAHMVRAEGSAKQAGFGMIFGSVLNIVLDPIFITVLNMQITGAALATFISNTAALLYYIVFIIRKKNSTAFKFSPRYYTVKEGIPKEVFLVGLPSFIMSMMSTLSNTTLNRLMSSYCNEAIAGVGIAKRIDVLLFGVGTGISQGVVPLIGYNYSSGNRKRMNEAILKTFILSLVISGTFTFVLYNFAQPIVALFIDDATTVQYGQTFQKIICMFGPCISITLIIISIFQSMGKKVQPLLLSLLRKGGIDVPFMFIMNSLLGVNGIVYATPIADVGAMVISLIVFIPTWKKLKDPAGPEHDFQKSAG